MGAQDNENVLIATAMSKRGTNKCETQKSDNSLNIPKAGISKVVKR